MKTRISELIGATNLEAKDKNALEDHARYLLSVVPDDSATLFVDPELPGKKIPVTRLKDIAKALSDARVVKKRPIPAMLASVAGTGIKERRQHEVLKSWVLLASLALLDRGSPVRRACRRVRRLGKPEDRWLFDELLDLKNDLDSIVERLQSLRDQYSGSTEDDRTKERKVAGLHVLLADLLYEREKRGPGPGGHRQISEPPYREQLIEFAPDDSLYPDIDGLKVIADEQRITGAGQGVESGSISDRYLDTIADDAYPTFLKRRVRQGRELARTFTMRATASRCDWEGLSDNEVHRTLELCFDAAVDGCRPSLWIVLALFLGRTPERLWSTPKQEYRRSAPHGEYWRVTKKRIQLVSYLSLPEFDLSYEDRQLVEPVYNCLVLSTPRCLTQPLRKALHAVWDEDVSTEELRKEMRKRIRTLNAEHNTRLTQNRLAAYLHRALVQSGECDVVSKRLRGVEPRSNYKQRYEALNQEETQRVYQQYATNLLGMIDRAQEWQDSQFKTQPLGSHIKVKDDAVCFFFEYLREEATPPALHSDDVIDFHNRYAMYVYQLLMLASGHRPVRVPLETVRSFDDVSHELYICDKVSNHASDARTVVLPDTACHQLSEYRDHLRALEVRCRQVAPQLCATIQGAISGTGPLLFRFEKNDRMAWSPVPFDPKPVRRWLQDDWSLPLNWHRHWLRSNLTERGQPHEYIDQFMGHENDQPPGMGRYSNLTYGGRQSLASCIDSMLAGLEITAIGGLSCNRPL